MVQPMFPMAANTVESVDSGGMTGESVFSTTSKLFLSKLTASPELGSFVLKRDHKRSFYILMITIIVYLGKQ